MERKLDWRLEAIELLRQSELESEDNFRADLPHKIEIILVNDHKRGGQRIIRVCQRCLVSWPCLIAQEEAIERGRQKRQDLLSH